MTAREWLRSPEAVEVAQTAIRQCGTDVSRDLATAALTALLDRMPDSPGIPPARLTALVTLLGPGEITPTAKRQLQQLCAEYET